MKADNHAWDDATGHTPGPWEIEILAAGLYTICAPGAGIVARVPTPIAGDKEANVRLIAAAPDTAAERDRLKAINADMLAALIGLDAAIREHNYGVNLMPEHLGVVNAARAAIARATGG